MQRGADLQVNDADDRIIDSQRHAYEKVRELILLGELKPDAWVSQVQLAAQLQLSRTPLREALRRLETEGLVQLDFNRRLRVAPLSVADLEALYALRLVTEPLAVRLSTPSLTDEQLEQAAVALAETNAAAERGDEATLLEAHRRFHFTLIAQAEERIQGQTKNLWDHAVRYVRIYHSAESFRMSLIVMSQDGHDQILRAVQRRDSLLASRLSADHLARTALTVLATVAGDHDPKTVREALRFVLDPAARPTA